LWHNIDLPPVRVHTAPRSRKHKRSLRPKVTFQPLVAVVRMTEIVLEKLSKLNKLNIWLLANNVHWLGIRKHFENVVPTLLLVDSRSLRRKTLAGQFPTVLELENIQLCLSFVWFRARRSTSCMRFPHICFSTFVFFSCHCPKQCRTDRFVPYSHPITVHTCPFTLFHAFFLYSFHVSHCLPPPSFQGDCSKVHPVNTLLPACCVELVCVLVPHIGLAHASAISSEALLLVCAPRAHTPPCTRFGSFAPTFRT
jgi:hypothetical protein